MPKNFFYAMLHLLCVHCITWIETIGVKGSYSTLTSLVAFSACCLVSATIPIKGCPSAVT